VATMLHMATEPNKPKKSAKDAKVSKKQPTRTGKPLHVWINDDLREQLEEAVNNARPKAKIKAHVEEALMEYLAKLGFWPPKKAAD
jgi:hypothetical protein